MPTSRRIHPGRLLPPGRPPVLLCLLVLFAAVDCVGQWANGGGPRDQHHDAQHSRMVIGPAVLDVRISRTANLFHMVDHMSGWHDRCHPQYRSAISHSEADRRLLDRYAAVRRAHGWGAGLEQTFYTDLPVSEALSVAVYEGILTPDEAAVVGETLSAFAERAEILFRDRLETMTRFVRGIAPEVVATPLSGLARLCGVGHVVVPVFPVASPAGGHGGTYNGGRLAIEIPPSGDPTATFLHELAHVFLSTRYRDIEATARNTAGLDPIVLNEAIAHAFAPGLVPSTTGGDTLADSLARSSREDRRATEEEVRQSRYLALALRPILREALARGTLGSFLEKARAIWMALAEVDPALRGAVPPQPQPDPSRGPARE